MNFKLLFTICILFIVIGSSVMAVATTTVAQILWTKQLGSEINTIDTSETGGLVYVGLANGSILSYNSGGTLLWQLNMNGSIKKLKTISDGSKVVALSNMNQTYWIDGPSGNIIKTIFNQSLIRNMSDIDISRDGAYFAVSGNSSLTIYDTNGNVYASNRTFEYEPWNLIALDPFMSWLVATNGANKTFKWNVTSYLGWPEMNSDKDVRNVSNIRDDGFINKTYFETSIIGDYNLTFIANKSSGSNTYPGIIRYYNNFWYNRSITGNLSIRDSITLVNIINKTNNNFTGMLNYSILSGHPTVNIYYGNMSYKYPNYVNGTIANGSMI